MGKADTKRGQYLLKLVGITLLLPLAIMAFGIWAQNNKTIQSPELQTAIVEQQKIVEEISTRFEKAGKPDFTIQYESGDMTYGGPMALTQAKRDLEEMKNADKMSGLRQKAVPTIIISAGISLLISILVLVTGLGLSTVGRKSRDALVHSFTVLRRLLPLAMAIQVVATTIAGGVALFFNYISKNDKDIFIVSLVFLGFGAFMLWATIMMHTNSRYPFMTLKANELEIAGLALPLSWGNIAKYDVTLANHQLITVLYLNDDAPLPQKIKGKGRVRINAKKKTVTIMGMLPRGLNFNSYVELLEKYLNAFDARTILDKHNIPKQV